MDLGDEECIRMYVFQVVCLLADVPPSSNIHGTIISSMDKCNINLNKKKKITDGYGSWEGSAVDYNIITDEYGSWGGSGVDYKIITGEYGSWEGSGVDYNIITDGYGS